MENSRMGSEYCEQSIFGDISSQDYQVLKLMREMDYGHLVITVKGGQPVHAEVQKSVLIK